jgi:exportin-1
VQQGEQPKPFIEEILDNLGGTIRDLEPNQILGFFEACAVVIAAQTVPEKRQALVFRLMEGPNSMWQQMIAQANQSMEFLWKEPTVRNISMVLRTNSRVASALGPGSVSATSSLDCCSVRAS